MSSPETAESEEMPHLKDPTDEDQGGTDSSETREHDGKYAVTDPLDLCRPHRHPHTNRNHPQNPCHQHRPAQQPP